MTNNNQAEMAGKVVLVTGASGGFGAEIAREFGRKGATVAVNYLSNQANAESVVNDIEQLGGKGIAVQGDLQQQDSVDAMLAAVSEQVGDIDILVLNYGPPAFWTRFVDQEQAALEEKILAELRSFFITAKTVSNQMVERGRGTIVGLSSVLARNTTEGFSAHAMAKSSVEAMLRAMALELAPAGIRVNTVSPSLSVTPGSSWVPQEGVDGTVEHTPLGRLCQPEDVAKVVAMVASDDAGFMCGAYVPVNGGLLMG